LIDDSIPWKEDLGKIAARLEKKRSQQRWTERSGFLVERDIMIGAYAVRRLIEASKVSTPLMATSTNVLAYPLTGERIPDAWSRVRFWEFYDMDSPSRESLSIRGVCNQIIHSWMWCLSASKDGRQFDGVYIASDKTRGTKLYHISVDSLISIFRLVADEDIAYSINERQSDGQIASVRLTEEQANSGNNDALLGRFRYLLRRQNSTGTDRVGE
jgi:hypothetical protein